MFQQGAEFVSFSAGETERVCGFVELQQFGLLRSATLFTCIKCLSVIMPTEL